MAVRGDDDDATPEVAFKNIPRRRRSAASSGPAPRPPPPKEEDPGGDDGPGRGGSSAPPPPPPALPSRDVRRAEKRRRLLLAEDAKNGGGGGAPLAPSRTTTDEAAASSGRELLPDDWAEKERIRKGKMPAASVDESRPAGSGRGKLMGDAIRCHGAGSKKKKKPPPKSKKRKGLGLGPPFWYGMGRDGQSTSTAGSTLDHSFFNLSPAVVTPGLRAALAGAGAAAPPVRVYGRLMSGCDRNTHQSRLQMSCKSWRAHEDGEYPVCAFLNAEEKAEAHGEGLVLKAYDRRGEKYDLKLRYLRCNSSYRLISKWGHLLRSNGLVVDKGGGGEAEPVMLELWLFRPPGGTVGMVVLHYYKGDAKHADAALEEEEDRRRAKRRRLELDDAYCYSAAAKASHRPPESNAASMDGGADGTDGKVKGDASATAEEPAGGGAKAAAEQQQAGGAKSAAAAVALPPDADGTKVKEKEAGGALVDASAPSSSDAVGGAAKVVEEEGGAAPGEADHGTMAAEEKDASAPAEADHGMMAAEEKDASAAPVEAAGAQSASPSDTGGAASKEAAPPPPPPGDDDGGAKKAASGFGLTSYEWFAALALVQLSRS